MSKSNTYIGWIKTKRTQRKSYGQLHLTFGEDNNLEMIKKKKQDRLFSAKDGMDVRRESSNFITTGSARAEHNWEKVEYKVCVWGRGEKRGKKELESLRRRTKSDDFSDGHRNIAGELVAGRDDGPRRRTDLNNTLNIFV